MVSVENIPSNYCFAGIGMLSIYDRKTTSRKPIMLEMPIACSLSVDGGLLFSFQEKDFIFESLEARQNLRKEFGLGFSPFTPQDFFNGRFMDDFAYDELTETISTFIIGGDLTSLGKARPASFIGNIKMIDDLIHLNTNFTLSNYEFLNSKPEYLTKSGKSKLVEFEIASKLVFTA